MSLNIVRGRSPHLTPSREPQGTAQSVTSGERCPDRAEGQEQGQNPGLGFFPVTGKSQVDQRLPPQLGRAEGHWDTQQEGTRYLFLPTSTVRGFYTVQHPPRHTWAHICTCTHPAHEDTLAHTHTTKPSTHTSSPLTQAHYTHAHTAAHSYLHTHTPRANRCCPRLFALQWFLLQSLKPLPLPQREVVGGRERRRGKGSQKGSVTAEATQQSQEDELSPYV